MGRCKLAAQKLDSAAWLITQLASTEMWRFSVSACSQDSFFTFFCHSPLPLNSAYPIVALPVFLLSFKSWRIVVGKLMPYSYFWIHLPFLSSIKASDTKCLFLPVWIPQNQKVTISSCFSFSAWRPFRTEMPRNPCQRDMVLLLETD